MSSISRQAFVDAPCSRWCALSVFSVSVIAACFLLSPASLLGQVGLIHHFPLDDETGLVAEDDASGALGNLINFENDDDSQWVLGIMDGALDMGTDATADNYLEFPLQPVDTTVTGGFTIAMWVQVGDSIASGDGEWTLFDNGEIGFNIRTVQQEGVFHDKVLLFWDTNYPNLTVGSTSLEPGSWYHVAVTSEGAGGAKKYYVNGEPDEAQIFAPSENGEDVATYSGWTADSVARIGNAGNRAHNSTFDDVRIYDVALTAEEIEALVPEIPHRPPTIVDRSPMNGEGFHNPDTPMFFVVEPFGSAEIAEEGIQVVINGVDVTADLSLSGTASSRRVVYRDLEAGTIYDVQIQVTDSLDAVTVGEMYFGTFTPVEGAPGLVHHFKFDETEGLFAVDRVGGRVGRLRNFENDDDSQWVDGQFVGGLDMGADETPDNSMEFPLKEVRASVTGGITIALWVNPGEEVTTQEGSNLEWTLFDNGEIGFNLRNAFIEDQTFTRVIQFWDTNFNQLTVGSTTLEPGTWYHVAVTTEGPGGAKTYYVDGEVEQETFFVTPEDGADDVATYDGWVAGTVGRVGAVGGGGRAHDSMFDDVRIYNVPLTQEEIQGLLTEEIVGPMFLRGDSNANGTLDIGDPIINLGHQFLGDQVVCRDALDYNDTNLIDISDPIANLTHQFLGGPPPALPGKVECGVDPTDDDGIDCADYPEENC